MSIEQFYKCDFHVHSYNDKATPNAGNSMDELSKNINESDIDCFAITDHNIFPADFFNELSKQISKDKVLFPGIELNMTISDQEIQDHNLVVNKDNYFHAVVIFDPTSELDKIQNLFENEFSKKESSISWKKYSEEIGTEKITIERLMILLKDVEYVFIPHENKSRGITNYLPNNVEENEQYKKKLFYYNTTGLDGKSTENYGLQRILKKTLFKEIPCFNFSDRSKFSKEWTWIQFNKTFEGLLIAMSDSKHRIFSSSKNFENPQKNVHDHVDKISFNQGNKKTEIELHPGYNAIIGSRGAGKSTLVEVIKKNDLSKRNINDIKYYFQSNPTNLNDNQIAYFEQGSFTDFFSNSENAKLSSINYLKELEVKLSEELKEENSKILLEINNLKEKILLVCGEYFDINDNDKFMILENSKITLSEESALEYKDIFEIEEKKHIDNVEVIGKIKVATEEIRKKEKDINISFKEDFNEYNKSIELQSQLTEVSSIVGKLYEIIIDIDLKLLYIKETSKKRSNMLTEFGGVNNEINKKINAEYQLLNDYVEEKREVLLKTFKFRRNLFDYFKELNECIQNTQEFEKIEEFIVDKAKYEIKIGKKTPSSLYEILCELKYKIEKDDFLKTLVNDFSFLSYEELISKFNNNIFSRQKITTKIGIVKKLFEKINEIINLDDLSISLLKDNKCFSTMSPGERVDSLLDVVFEKDIKEKDYKLIIFDQPEDNLDVGTIKEKLLNKIRDLKLSKQIIIVSHSAPLVVNGDANNIIISKYENEIFNYTNGGFCKKQIRSEVVNILDGGEQYMKERFNKYVFKYEEDKKDGN